MKTITSFILILFTLFISLEAKEFMFPCRIQSAAKPVSFTQKHFGRKFVTNICFEGSSPTNKECVDMAIVFGDLLPYRCIDDENMAFDYEDFKIRYSWTLPGKFEKKKVLFDKNINGESAAIPVTFVYSNKKGSACNELRNIYGLTGEIGMNFTLVMNEKNNLYSNLSFIKQIFDKEYTKEYKIFISFNQDKEDEGYIFVSPVSKFSQANVFKTYQMDGNKPYISLKLDKFDKYNVRYINSEIQSISYNNNKLDELTHEQNLFFRNVKLAFAYGNDFTTLPMENFYDFIKKNFSMITEGKFEQECMRYNDQYNYIICNESIKNIRLPNIYINFEGDKSIIIESSKLLIPADEIVGKQGYLLWTIAFSKYETYITLGKNVLKNYVSAIDVNKEIVNLYLDPKSTIGLAPVPLANGEADLPEEPLDNNKGNNKMDNDKRIDENDIFNPIEIKYVITTIVILFAILLIGAFVYIRKTHRKNIEKDESKKIKKVYKEDNVSNNEELVDVSIDEEEA